MKRTFLYIIILLIVVLLVFVKIKFFTPDNPKGNNNMQGKPKTALVTAIVAKPETLDNKIFVSGSVVANEAVDLVPEIAGKITLINFREGSRVSKGELLVKFNDADLQAQQKKNRLNEKLAAEKESRQKQLLEIGGVSQEEYDIALTELNSVKADIELTQAQIEKTEIRAPFSGIVGLRSVSAGSFVSTSTKIASIQQTDPLKIDFFIPEKYASLVKTGDSLTYTVVGNDETYIALVAAIEPAVDDITRTIHIRAVTHNHGGRILPGASARIIFPLSKSESAILIPTEAVIPILKGQKVFVCRDGNAEEAIIKTGLRTETSVEIIDGIQAGDTVIVTGIMQLKAGIPVKITAIQ
ncbi:MAG: efflux RND transporter periplasmic adaptor subunit [Bacteroidetes bacterium]|nr:efflux RND transporter periplasmic adaptor subunit [Bacteroidota bacterium]MBU1719840.1 efflux RND transporter periplasmic adaptor subunit [Bacteroidota bacterium]